jgi:hypothetical protein
MPFLDIAEQLLAADISGRPLDGALATDVINVGGDPVTVALARAAP